MTDKELKELRHQLALARQEIEELQESNELKQEEVEALRQKVKELMSK